MGIGEIAVSVVAAVVEAALTAVFVVLFLRWVPLEARLKSDGSHT